MAALATVPAIPAIGTVMSTTTAAMTRTAVTTEKPFQHAHVLLPFCLAEGCGNVAGGDGFPQGLVTVESLKQLQGQARVFNNPRQTGPVAQVPPEALPSSGR